MLGGAAADRSAGNRILHQHVGEDTYLHKTTTTLHTALLLHWKQRHSGHLVFRYPTQAFLPRWQQDRDDSCCSL